MNIEFSIELNPKQLVKLNETVHDKHYISHPDVFNPFDEQSFKVWFNDVLSKEDTICVFAKNGEKYIGYALLFHKKISETNPFNKADFEILHVDQMSIEKDYQNMGVGKKLLEFIKTLAAKMEIKRIQLDVWSDNEQAKNFYKKNGFNTSREIMEMKLS